MEFVLRELDTTVLGVFAILVFFIFIQIRRFKAVNDPRKPPECAGGWPLIGHLNLLRGPQFPHIALGALADKYGPVFSIRIGIHPTVVISNWEVAKECYTTNDKAVSSRPCFMAAEILSWNYAMFGFGPYNSYWREIRKITASDLLSNTRLELLKHVRASELEGSLKELYKLWEKKQKGLDDSVQVEMKQWMGDINLNVILRMVVGKRYFGSVMEAHEKEALRCMETFREFFHYVGLFLVSDAIPFLRWFDLGGYEKAMKKTAKKLDCLADEWLIEHRKKRDSNNFDADQQDFMDVMLSVLDGADLAGFDADTVNKATCMALIAGSTDTTTVTLVWVLSLLLNNPSVLSKVQEELDIHVGKERRVDESDISKLVYLQAVVKESLRLYPAGPLSGTRELIEDCFIGGYYVPKGTRLITNIWKIQTDPKIWPEPFEFKPERFLTTHKDINVKGKHFEYIPFGGGRRACPGLTLGLQMTHLIIAGLVQAFDVFTTNEPVDMTGSFGLTNMKATPLDVLVKPRLLPYVYS